MYDSYDFKYRIYSNGDASYGGAGPTNVVNQEIGAYICPSDNASGRKCWDVCHFAAV